MAVREETKQALPMPIRATPYQHQIEAFNFVCGLFDLTETQKGVMPMSTIKNSSGCALLMEM